MNKKITIFWCFVAVLQIFLLYFKIKNESFNLWNIVVFAISVFFFFNRIKRKKPQVESEISLAILLGLNSIFIGITQLLVNNYLYFIAILIFTILTFYMSYYIWRIENKKTL